MLALAMIAASAGHDAFRNLAGGGNADDVPREVAALQGADHPGARVELHPAEAVARRGREGVMVVVPGLAEGERRKPGQVARLVVRPEGPPAEEVTQRVDAERRVVHEEDADRAAPQKGGQAATHPA